MTIYSALAFCNALCSIASFVCDEMGAAMGFANATLALMLAGMERADVECFRAVVEQALGREIE